MRRLLLVLALAAATTCHAAEIRVLASNGVKATLEQLTVIFVHTSKNNVTITYDLAATLKRQIEAGAPFDVAILTSAGIEDLVRQGKIDATSRTAVARSAVGIAVRAGAPKPDLATPEALKQTLLAAKSITWAKQGASGVYFASVVEKLGIAKALEPKLNLAASGAQVGEKIAAGEAELGALLINEIMTLKGVEVAGPLPAELQSYTVFHAGVSAASKNPAVSRVFIQYLVTPAAGEVFKAKGQEPG